MTYGLNLGLFAGSGPTVQPTPSSAKTRRLSSYAAWHSLDAERRLALVEVALAAPANDNADGFPAAL